MAVSFAIGSRPRTHPLPAGMRDLLPDEARRRRALGQRVLDHFGLHGYDLVTLPAFEFAEVLERGLGTLEAADVLRFIEPESGDVAALRPDMTPQIARLVATRLTSAPRPIRLCYEGTVVRRRPGRARRHRQVAQAGVELYGVGTLTGDLEILRLAASVVREAVGLERFVVDVGHARIARALLAAAPDALGEELSDALEQKDASRLALLLADPAAAGVPPQIAAALAALPDLQGGGAADPDGRAVLARATDLLAGTAAEAPLAELAALWEAARRSPELREVVRLDLGEIRGLAYYTGAIFHVLAEGPGEPIASGGRYDDLLGRFGAPMPAVGFALQLDAVGRAREAAGLLAPAPPRVVVAVAGPRGDAVAGALRAAGVSAVVLAPDADADPERHGRAWGCSHVARERAGAITVAPIGDPRAEIAVEVGNPAAMAAAVRA